MIVDPGWLSDEDHEELAGKIAGLTGSDDFLDQLRASIAIDRIEQAGYTITKDEVEL